MVFYRISQGQQIETVADFIYRRIHQTINKGKSALWLLPGGSAIPSAVAASQKLADDKSIDNKKLFIALTDERWGTPGHPDSNYYQLKAAGFKLTGPKFYEVIQKGSIASDSQKFNSWLEATVAKCGYKIGLFGMGGDGHTAGILPGSPASSSENLVDYYQAQDYARITTTPLLFKQLDLALILALGVEKKQQLLSLNGNKTTALAQPAQYLKKAKELIIFNDQIGEKYENRY